MRIYMILIPVENLKSMDSRSLIFSSPLTVNKIAKSTSKTESKKKSGDFLWGHLLKKSKKDNPFEQKG